MKPTKVYDVKWEGPITTEIPDGDPPSSLYKNCDDMALVRPSATSPLCVT